MLGTARTATRPAAKPPHAAPMVRSKARVMAGARPEKSDFPLEGDFHEF